MKFDQTRLFFLRRGTYFSFIVAYTYMGGQHGMAAKVALFFSFIKEINSCKGGQNVNNLIIQKSSKKDKEGFWVELILLGLIKSIWLLNQNSCTTIIRMYPLMLSKFRFKRAL